MAEQCFDCGGSDEYPCLHCQLTTERTAREAAEAELELLRETWTDEHGTVWSPPTAFAYAKVCAARDRKEAELERVNVFLGDIAPGALENNTLGAVYEIVV